MIESVNRMMSLSVMSSIGEVMGIAIIILIIFLILVYIVFVSPELKNIRMLKSETRNMTPDQATAFRYYAERIGWFGERFMGREYIVWKEYNSVLKKTIQNTCSLERALDKLGICENDLTLTEPILLQGFEFNHAKKYINENKEKAICVREVKFTDSSKWISDTYELVYLIFTDKQLFLYTCSFSTIDSETRETTCEFFYQDITSLATHPETFEFTTKKDCLKFETEIFNVVVPGDKIKAAINGTKNREKVVNEMKSLLREKKIK